MAHRDRIFISWLAINEVVRYDRLFLIEQQQYESRFVSDLNTFLPGRYEVAFVNENIISTLPDFENASLSYYNVMHV